MRVDKRKGTCVLHYATLPLLQVALWLEVSDKHLQSRFTAAECYLKVLKTKALFKQYSEEVS